MIPIRLQLFRAKVGRWSWLLPALLFIFLVPSLIEAHAGGTPRIVNEPSGDFVISVWTLPDPISSGTEANFIVFVADASDFSQTRAATPVLGAEVDLTFTNGRREVNLLATHDLATNKLFYESYPMLPDDGVWTVDVAVAYEGKAGAAQFDIDVVPATAETNWLLYGGIGLVVIAIGWFVWQSRQDEDEEGDDNDNEGAEVA